MNGKNFSQVLSRPLWWLRPYALLAVVIIPTYIMSCLYMMGPVRTGAAKQFYGAIDIDTHFFLLGLVWLCVVSLFAWIGQMGDSSKNLPEYVSSSTLKLLLYATFFGYALFFIGALRGGISQVADVVAGQTGAASAIKTSGQLMPGLSTMTQFGPAYCAGYAFLSPEQRKHWIEKSGFIIVIVLSIARAVIWSERLAIIEVCVPAAIAWAIQSGGGKRPFVRFLLSIAPFLGLAGLVAMFTAFESVRSWQHYAPIYGGDILAFSRERLILYYATALNNGVSIVKNIPHSPEQLYTTFGWLFRMPVVSSILPMSEYNSVSDSMVDLNMHYLDQEFTNPSGIFMYIWDYGPLLSIPMAAVVGLLAGRVYRSSVRGRLVGRLILPFLILGILEILRVPILTSGRFFYIWLGVCALIFLKNPQLKYRGRAGARVQAGRRPVSSMKRVA